MDVPKQTEAGDIVKHTAAVRDALWQVVLSGLLEVVIVNITIPLHPHRPFMFDITENVITVAAGC